MTPSKTPWIPPHLRLRPTKTEAVEEAPTPRDRSGVDNFAKEAELHSGNVGSVAKTEDQGATCVVPTSKSYMTHVKSKQNDPGTSATLSYAAAVRGAKTQANPKTNTQQEFPERSYEQVTSSGVPATSTAQQAHVHNQPNCHRGHGWQTPDLPGFATDSKADVPLQTPCVSTPTSTPGHNKSDESNKSGSNDAGHDERESQTLADRFEPTKPSTGNLDENDSHAEKPTEEDKWDQATVLRKLGLRPDPEHPGVWLTHSPRKERMALTAETTKAKQQGGADLNVLDQEAFRPEPIKPNPDDEKFRTYVEDWIKQVRELPCLFPQDLSGYAENREWKGPTGEFAPRNWIPDPYRDGTTPQSLLELYKSEALQTANSRPAASSRRSELLAIEQDAAPFWQRYEAHRNPVLKPLEVPDCKVDLAALMHYQIERYEKDRGSGRLVKDPDARPPHVPLPKDPFRPAHRGNATLGLPHALVIAPDPNRPKVNMFVRNAKLEDMQQLTKIYNHYITKTCIRPEMEEVDSSVLLDRWQNSTQVLDHPLPFYVAVLKSARRGGRRGYGFAATPEDTILGFAFLEPDGEPTSMWASTCKLEIYVHPDYLSKGVGKNILDRLIWSCDYDYPAKFGCEFFRGETSMGDGQGSCTYRMDNIVVYLPTASNDKRSRIWRTRFLNDFGFKQVGLMRRIGIKHETWISRAIFQRKCRASCVTSLRYEKYTAEELAAKAAEEAEKLRNESRDWSPEPDSD